MTAAKGGLRTGELAEASGLSVRTVRYYDQIGLLSPSQRTAAGHRLYDDSDVRRLYRICLLRRTGLSLADIRGALDDAEWDLAATLRTHLRIVDGQIALGETLRRRLSGMTAALTLNRAVPTAEFLDTLEEMSMLDTALQHRISILVYQDIPAMHEFLVRVFGLGAGQLHYDENGECQHGEVDAGDGPIWLHPVSPRYRLDSPRGLGGTNGITAVLVDDVDAHYARAREAGAEIVAEPVDQPYGYREYSARDPEGGFWSFMKSLDE